MKLKKLKSAHFERQSKLIPRFIIWNGRGKTAVKNTPTPVGARCHEDRFGYIRKNIESVIKPFAVDTSVSLALNDPDRRAAILNSDLEKINSWAKWWKVSFIEEKKLNC